jgi:diguanylate cyclase (GGDEF)-like protein
LRNIKQSLRPWLLASLQGTTLLGLAMIALIWVSLNFHLNAEREKSLQSTIQTVSNLARVFEEHTIRTINEIDKTLLLLRKVYEKDPRHFDISSWTNNGSLLSDLTLQFTIVGPDGLLKASSTFEINTKTDLSDREYFKHHRTAVNDPLLISKPVLGRTSGKWTIQVTRRLRMPNGSFGGMVVASLDPEQLSRFYESIDLGNNGAIALRGTDGIIRAFRGFKDGEIGDSGASRLLERHMGESPNGYFYGVDEVDGIARIVAYRTVTGYPLIVTVGISDKDALVNYRNNRRSYYSVGAGVTVLILIVIALSTRHRMGLDRTREALSISEAHALKKSRELEVTLEHMNQGIMMIDSHHNIPVINRQAGRLLDLPEHFLEVHPNLEELLDYLGKRGEFGRDNEKLMPTIREIQNVDGARGAPKITERTRPNGVVLEICNVALAGGGVVRTLTDITDRKKNESQIAYMACHDALTNLANRVLLREQIDQALLRLKRYDEHFAIFCLDLDKFKIVNDTFGHAVGDELLKEVANRLKNCTREIDVVARLGGDEFAILLISMQSQEEAINLANRILQVISAPYDIKGHQVIIGTTLGIALAPHDGTESEQLLRNADLALYRAKSEGRNGFRFFDAEMDAQVRTRRAIELELHKALKEGEFELHFQPWINLYTRMVGGCETLVRWNHPTRGMIPPADFVSIAEEAGLINPLGEWVLREACAAASKWPRHLKVAVNLSPAQFLSSNLMEVVTNALSASGLAPDRLELEITESVLLQEHSGILATLHKLRNLGVSIALDDFGTGYSSLKYLRTFPFDRIKIDRMFVEGLTTRTDCAAIVSAIAGLGRSLGMATTAEGVETREQLEMLRIAGCTEAQGYLFSRPISAADMTRFLAEHSGRVHDAA